MQNKPRKSNENNFMALLNLIVDPAVIVDEKGRFLIVNDAFVNLTGLSKKEVIGTVFLNVSLLTAESKALLLKNFKKRMQGLPVEPYEINFTDKTGKALYVEVKAKKIDYAGQPADLVIFRDITRRRNNERRLKEYSEKMEALVNDKVKEVKESEEKYRELINGMNDTAWVIDLDGNFIDVNDAAVKVLGYSREELLSMGPPDIDNSLTVEQIRTLIRNMPADQIQVFETAHTTKNGKTIPVEISSSLVTYQGKQAILSIARDITERKKSEEALRASEKYLEAILNSVLTGVVIIDEKTHQIVDANLNALEAIGASKEHIIGKVCHCFICPAEKGKCPISDLGQTVDKSERVLLRAGGERLPILKTVTTTTLRGHKYLIESFIDITERKKSEENLLASEKKYRKLFENLKLAEKQLLEERDRAQNYLDIADVMLVALDTKGRVTLLNRKGCAILKCTAEEALGKNWFDNFLPKYAKNNVKKIFQASIKRKKCLLDYNENYVVSKGGEVHLIAWHNVLLRNSRGQVIGTLSSGEDITEWKKAQQALIDSEEKFRSIVENSNDVVMLTLPDGVVSYLSPACFRVMGYNPEDLVGTRPSIFHPDDIEKVNRTLLSALNGKRGTDLEYRIITKAGETRWISHSWSPILENGKVKLIVSLVRGITERKQIEMKLQEAEKRYRTLFDQAPLGILLIDQTGTAVEFNEEAHRQLGYSREEFTKLTVSDYEVLETAAKTRARMRNILKTGRDEFETKHRTKTGEIRDVINTVQVIELAGKKFFHLITRDITEQKKIENELEMERNKLEAVTENVGAGLAIISKDYRILWANKLLKQIYGCEGKICYSTFNNLTGICPDCGVKKVFEKGVPIDVHEYITKDDKGNAVWVELIVTPIKDEEGNVIAALELAVNITERKIMQSKLAEYSQKLEKIVEERTEQLKRTQAKLVKSERLATIGELAAMIGHDLRNPLTGIMGAAYYLKAKHGTEISAKGKEMLETIEKAINHSNKIINDLLEYSRDLKLELTETTPKAMLQSALSLLEVPEKIQIIDTTENEPMVKADTEKIRKVFVNIIQNAIDAMPEGGTLTIKNRKVNDKLEIAFQDTGTGMSEETLSNLKGGVPLFTTKAKGMGFGLPICKRIVEAHGGKIRVKSTAGKGTTVAVTIPVNPEPVDEEEEKWIFSESMLSAIIAARRAP